MFLQHFLKNKSFILFLCSAFLLYLVNQFYLLAQVSIVLKLTNSTVLLGTILMIMVIPRLIALPIGGMLSDKFREKNIIISGFIAYILLFTTLVMLAHFNKLSIIPIMIFACLFGAISAFILPATYSIVPKLVSKEHLQKANATVQFTSQFTMIIGPAIAGLLLGLIQNSYYFFIMVALVLISLLLIFKTTINNENITNEINEENAIEKSKKLFFGFKIIFKNQTLVLLLLFTAILNMVIAGPQQVGLPVLAETYLEIGPIGLGYLLSTFGLGSILGSIVGGIVKKNISVFFLTLYGFIFGVIWSFSAWFNNMLLVLILLCIAGFLIGLINVIFITILQIASPKYLLGRIMSLQFMGAVALQPISHFITGILISTINLKYTYLLAGSAITVFSLIMLTKLKFNKSIIE